MILHSFVSVANEWNDFYGMMNRAANIAMRVANFMIVWKGVVVYTINVTNKGHNNLTV